MQTTQLININITDAPLPPTPPITPPGTTDPSAPGTAIGFLSGSTSLFGLQIPNLAILIGVILLILTIITITVFMIRKKHHGKPILATASLFVMALLTITAIVPTPNASADTLISDLDPITVNIVKPTGNTNPITKTAQYETTVTTDNESGYILSAQLDVDQDTIDSIDAGMEIQINDEDITTTPTDIYFDDTGTSPDTATHELSITVPANIAVGAYKLSVIHEVTDIPANEEVIDLAITNSPNGAYFSYDEPSRVYTIQDGANVLVINSNVSTQNRIVVESGASATVMLDNVTIDMSTTPDTVAFDVTNAEVTLIIKGMSNSIIGSNGVAGTVSSAAGNGQTAIQATGGTLMIDSVESAEGSLVIIGGDGGIGSSSLGVVFAGGHGGDAITGDVGVSGNVILTAIGGAGGNGGKYSMTGPGGNGGVGINGHLTTNESCVVYATGGTGGVGASNSDITSGALGGNGGSGIADGVTASGDSTVTANGGNAGNGGGTYGSFGPAGNGGNGGTGIIGDAAVTDTGNVTASGGNGGNGGISNPSTHNQTSLHAGAGGNGGNGMLGNVSIILSGIVTADGGNGGNGGNAADNNTATIGLNGGNAGNGGNGIVGNITGDVIGVNLFVVGGVRGEFGLGGLNTGTGANGIDGAAGSDGQAIVP